MALHWDTRKCEPPTPICDGDAQNLDTLIWSTIAVDLGAITKANVKEWQFRLRFLEQCGMALTVKPMPMHIVHRWIGLSVNVCDKTRKQWLKKVMGNLERRVEDNVFYENKPKEVAEPVAG